MGKCSAWTLLCFLMLGLLLPVETGAIPLLKNVMPGQVAEPHAKVENSCLKCHTLLGKRFHSNCLSCHKEVREDLKKEGGFHGRIDASRCETCHTEHKGRAAPLVFLDKEKFDHLLTNYVLEGKHRTVECEKCHQKPKYRETPKGCFACHEKDDYHKKALGTECERCHIPDSWKEIHFDHSKTKFALTGKHEKVACDKCHTAQFQVKETPTDCYTCHRKDDPHKEILGTKCETCHTTQDWKKSTFDHSKTRYPLVGKHRDVTCLKCHQNTLLKETPTDCFQCHKKDDPHKGNLGTTCDQCHTPSQWTQVRFDHSKTKYPLLGKHQQVACQKCHGGERYKGIPTSCVQCHKKDDPHKEILGIRCENCHVEKDWKSLTFDHSKTEFPLLDKHKQVECLKCHKNSKLKETPKACNGCHQKDDVHKGKLKDRCDRCHDVKSWKKATLFDHQKSSFPLKGKHKPVACDKCHKTSLFQDTSAKCYSCHKKDDEHRGRFGTQCEKCHAEDTFERKDFSHEKEVGYPLLGAHADVKCLDCHLKPLFTTKTPKTCGICHRSDDIHNGELGPRCDRCHTPSSFAIEK